MKIEETTLKNGAKIIGIKMPNTKTVVINIGFRVGSRHEDPKYAGISHFLEHMVFKGSKKRPTAAAISREADGIGATFNAFTEKELTAYHIKSTKDNFNKSLDILADMALNPLLSERELKKERGTIIEEIRMYRDTPMEDIGWRMEESFFGIGTPLGRDELGTEQSVTAINSHVMNRYHAEHYCGKNCVAIICGDIPTDYKKKITKYLGKLNSGEKITAPPPTASQKTTNLVSKRTEQAHFGIIIPGYSFSDEKRRVAGIISTILGGYMSSRLFTEIREKRGLAYHIGAYNQKFTDTGCLEVVAGVRTDKIEEAIKIIKKELLNFSKTVTEEEIKRAKSYITGSYPPKFDDPSERTMYSIYQHLLSNNPETPEQMIKAIQKVTKKEIIEVANEMFKKENLCLAIIGPFKDKEKFAKILAQ